MAPWRGVQNDAETVIKITKKGSKISVLEPKKGLKSRFWSPKSRFGRIWSHLGAPSGAQGVAGSLLSRFLLDFDVILGTLLDVIFEDFRTIGVSGAQGDLRVVSKGRVV